MTLSLNHYSIRTTDLKAVEAFYTDVLQLSAGPRPDFPFPGVWMYNGSHDNVANAVVHIIGIDATDPEGLKKYLGDRDLASLQGTGAVDHIAFFATGLPAMLTHLKGLGVPFRERQTPSIGLFQLFLDDPCGVVVELNYPAEEKRALDSTAGVTTA
jgi:catechol 2,3-dioxygenase-like lactoylglutathione lyase family enzyme